VLCRKNVDACCVHSLAALLLPDASDNMHDIRSMNVHVWRCSAGFVNVVCVRLEHLLVGAEVTQPACRAQTMQGPSWLCIFACGDLGPISGRSYNSRQFLPIQPILQCMCSKEEHV